MDLLDLSIEQTRQGAPEAFRLSGVLNPLAEMCREGVEVEIETITAKDR